MASDDSETSASESIVIFESATVKARENFATHHLWSAKHMARLCAEREQEIISENRIDTRHRAYVMNTVLSVAIFIETLINEVYQDVADTKPGVPNPRTEGIPESAAANMRQLWSQMDTDMERPLTKYQLALLCSGQPMYDPGNDTNYQHVFTLIRLRNDLVHYKPKYREVSGKSDSLEGGLRALLTTKHINQQPVGNPWYPNKAFGAGLARRACEVSVAFVDDWWKRMGLVRDYASDLDTMPNP